MNYDRKNSHISLFSLGFDAQMYKLVQNMLRPGIGATKIVDAQLIGSCDRDTESRDNKLSDVGALNEDEDDCSGLQRA